jgi:hypothetical protein
MESTALVQHESPTIPGLLIVISHETGEVFASQSALARLIDKDSVYVRNHEKSMVQGG